MLRGFVFIHHDIIAIVGPGEGYVLLSMLVVRGGGGG